MTYTAVTHNARTKPAHGRAARIFKWAAVITAVLLAGFVAFIVLLSASVIRR